ncbi:dihydrofolate reductase [Exiguobacterium aestuarii]|uniref:Dihydrofolate reductase n=1 Tax=Exiguobacterium aestuarii TaxID=273527 RepID=A0ABW2PPB0_9BACL|nr:MULTISPECIES: dihydrofolate reductase [Exiguobacterium]MCT4784927.1 dihydrofolate reductase [Exiguobacterium aestuarii]
MISHVVAYGLNREIGKDNDLLWRLPDDLKHFKTVTSGGTVVMGRKTFESIGKALPNRRNIVVTSDPSFEADQIEVWHDLERLVEESQNEEWFVIGGATLYDQTMSVTSRIYATEVESTFEGDTFYPERIGSWTITHQSNHPQDDKHAYAFSFIQYDKADIDE